MILGAILAGGQARRFGADKAAAQLDGVAMIDRIAAILRPQVDALVVVGRDWEGLVSVPDRPAPGLGPLGGLAGALAHAQAEGFTHLLTSGCDLPDLPADLLAALTPGPAAIAGQPLLGLWPATLAGTLANYLRGGGDQAMRSWIAHTGTRRVVLDGPLANINTQADLAAFLSRSP